MAFRSAICVGRSHHDAELARSSGVDRLVISPLGASQGFEGPPTNRSPAASPYGSEKCGALGISGAHDAERHIPRLGDGNNRGYVVGYVHRGTASPSRAKLAANEPLTGDREVSRSNCLSRFRSRARFPTMSDAVTSATRVAPHNY